MEGDAGIECGVSSGEGEAGEGRGSSAEGTMSEVLADLWFFVVIGFVCVVLLVVGDRSFPMAVNQGGRSERHVFGKASTRQCGEAARDWYRVLLWKTTKILL